MRYATATDIYLPIRKVYYDCVESILGYRLFLFDIYNLNKFCKITIIKLEIFIKNFL